MIKAKDLRHKAGQLAARQKAILEAAVEKMTPDQEKEFDTLHDEEQILIKQAKKIEMTEAAQLESEHADEVHDSNKKKTEFTAEEKKSAERIAMQQFLLTGSVPQELRQFMAPAQADKDDNKQLDAELKKLGITRTAQQSTTSSAGGYTIPEGFQAELERATKEFGGMMEAARMWKTTTGNVVDWPNTNDTANKSYLLAEAGNAETSAAAIVFSRQQFEAYKYTSGLVRVSAELIEDSAFNMAETVLSILAERQARGLNTAFTTADGSSKPKGIVVGSTYGCSTADDAGIVLADIINLEHSVDPSYRNRPGTRFMFHDNLLKALKKLKDTTNQPIWMGPLGGWQSKAPATLLGYNYTINQDMFAYADGSATLNDSQKIALFGDLQKYVIRQVAAMRMVRLNERFGDTDEIGFVLFSRFDGDLLDAGTHPVKHLRASAT
jgi:HK97 family phage major capsid protein